MSGTDSADNRHVKCPHCNGAIVVTISQVNIAIFEGDGIAIGATSAERRAAEKATQTTSEHVYESELPLSVRMLLDGLRSSGIYDTILKVKQIRDGRPITRRANRFVLTFLRDISQHVVPREILHILADTYRGEITVFGHNGVSLVLSSGRIVLVIPTEYLRGARNKLGAVGGQFNNVSVRTTPEQVATWIRTRNGYVPADKQLFLAVLQRESRGGFEIPDNVKR